MIWGFMTVLILSVYPVVVRDIHRISPAGVSPYWCKSVAIRLVRFLDINYSYLTATRMEDMEKIKGRC
jgi:hypothetical protein